VIKIYIYVTKGTKEQGGSALAKVDPKSLIIQVLLPISSYESDTIYVPLMEQFAHPAKTMSLKQRDLHLPTIYPLKKDADTSLGTPHQERTA
jgi:hypothetical protein